MTTSRTRQTALRQPCAPVLRLVAVLVGAGILGWSAPAHAVCFGGLTTRHQIAGQVPDLFFDRGTPSTQYIKPIHVIFDSVEGYSDCMTFARSNVPGVSIQMTYGAPGNGYVAAAGEWTTIFGSHGPSSPVTYTPGNGWPDLYSGLVPVIYDGSATVQSGTIDIAVNQGDETIHSYRIIGRVNVYVSEPGASPTTWFRVTSTTGTVSGDSLLLSHPLLDANPSTAVFVSHYWTGINWNHATAVTYDSSLRKWKIRNEDGTLMPVGLSFNVRIDPTASRVQTPFFTVQRYVVIDHPDANWNPYATVIVTPVTSGRKRLTHPIAVAYAAPNWLVVTSDGANFPSSDRTGAVGFFVKVIAASAYVDDSLAADPSGFVNTNLSNGVGIDLNGPSRVSGNTKYLSRFCWTTHAATPLSIIVTPNITPLPPPAPRSYNSIDPKYFGVRAVGNRLTGYTMAVYHEDNTPMPATSALNVWGPYRADCPATSTDPVIGPVPVIRSVSLISALP